MPTEKLLSILLPIKENTNKSIKFENSYNEASKLESFIRAVYILWF
jgi:hypothetical protein